MVARNALTPLAILTYLGHGLETQILNLSDIGKVAPHTFPRIHMLQEPATPLLFKKFLNLVRRKFSDTKVQVHVLC